MKKNTLTHSKEEDKKQFTFEKEEEKRVVHK